VSDFSKSSAGDETTKGQTVSLEAHAAKLNAIGLLAQPLDDAELGTASNETVADTTAGGSGDDAGARYQDAQTSTDDSSDSWR
jgi:hypothetical protein